MTPLSDLIFYRDKQSFFNFNKKYKLFCRTNIDSKFKNFGKVVPS